MTYVSRAKEAIKQIARFDAGTPTNAQLGEMGQAALYHPAARQIWDTVLAQNSLVINPDNQAVLDDIGTLSGEVFTSASAGTINAMIAVLFLRLTRKQWKDWLKAYRLRFTNAPAEPLAEAKATLIATADTDAGVIVGNDDDDPES